MTDHGSRRPSAGVRVAIVAVVAWVVLEAVVRTGGALTADAVVGDPVVGDWAALLIGFPAIAALLSRYALRSGQRREDWDYDWTARPVAIGAVAGVASIAVIAALGRVDAALFGAGRDPAAAADAFVATIEAFPLAAAVFLLGNGILVPIAEERVWRGVVQTELVARWDVVAGIVVTAALFSLKHAVIDASLGRLTAIFGAGLVWGLVRERWGTGASTAAHVVANLLSSASLVATALL